METLELILHEAKAHALKASPFLAVFDLDSTLFDLTLRVSQIVDEFAESPLYRERFPKECADLKRIEILATDWGIGEGLVRLGLQQEKCAEFWKALHDHWAAAFFSNDYLHHDEPLPGAVEFVLELRKLGAHIMYLTGRDIPRMYEGTEKSLLARGFPVDPVDARLVLKPEAPLDDARFKVDVLKEAEKTYDRIWLFENEPVNTNLVAKECPRIGIVFIETTHSGREQPDPSVAKIAHFDSWPRQMKS